MRSLLQVGCTNRSVLSLIVMCFAIQVAASAQAPSWQPSGSSVIYASPLPPTANINVGIGTDTPAISLDVRTGALPQMGIAQTTDYLTFFASDLYGPAIYWDPNKDMRFGKGGTGLYDPINFHEYMRIATNGNVGIGTTSPAHLLHVAGTIGAEEVIVSSTGADYVFQPDYQLRGLQDVARYIKENHHLPDIPSATEVKEKGLSLGDMQARLLAKIEELTLHVIREDQRNNQLEQKNLELQERVAKLEAQRAEQ